MDTQAFQKKIDVRVILLSRMHPLLQTVATYVQVVMRQLFNIINALRSKSLSSLSWLFISNYSEGRKATGDAGLEKEKMEKFFFPLIRMKNIPLSLFSLSLYFKYLWSPRNICQ